MHGGDDDFACSDLVDNILIQSLKENISNFSDLPEIVSNLP